MPTKQKYYTYNDVHLWMHSIVAQMYKDKWRPDYIVGLTRGGLVPAVILSNMIDVPMHTLKVSLRDHEDTESNCWMAEDAFGYGGSFEGKAIYDEYKQKNILIVDDLNDSGATFNWIVNDWQASCIPNSEIWDKVWGNNVRFAVGIDNLSSGFTKKVSYYAEELNKAEEDVWIVFPWEK
jgi:hypoxanthine phosphoribosyltransferase